MRMITVQVFLQCGILNSTKLNHTGSKNENLFIDSYAELKRINKVLKISIYRGCFELYSVNYFVKQHLCRRHFRMQYHYTLKQKALINKQIKLFYRSLQ